MYITHCTLHTRSFTLHNPYEGFFLTLYPLQWFHQSGPSSICPSSSSRNSTFSTQTAVCKVPHCLETLFVTLHTLKFIFHAAHCTLQMAIVWSPLCLISSSRRDRCSPNQPTNQPSNPPPTKQPGSQPDLGQRMIEDREKVVRNVWRSSDAHHLSLKQVFQRAKRFENQKVQNQENQKNAKFGRKPTHHAKFRDLGYIDDEIVRYFLIFKHVLSFVLHILQLRCIFYLNFNQDKCCRNLTQRHLGPSCYFAKSSLNPFFHQFRPIPTCRKK